MAIYDLSARSASTVNGASDRSICGEDFTSLSEQEFAEAIG
jgi:hypothetical protein